MPIKLQSREKGFLRYVNKMQAFKEALGLIYWDVRTGAPKKGLKQRSKVIGILSTEIFQMSTSEEIAAYIAHLSGQEGISELAAMALEQCETEYVRNKKIPTAIYEQYTIIKAEAEVVWQEAREKADFAQFQPYLEKLVSYNQTFIDYWGYDGNKYDTLLDHYEPGVTVKEIDKQFSQLKQVIIPFVQKIGSADQIDNQFLFTPIQTDKQKQWIRKILRNIGYDFHAGRMDETVHPFATGLNPGDVRITTRYDENNWQMALFGAIHEAGHAIYEQNIPEKFIGTPLCASPSMGIHESQSLFYENILARDRCILGIPF